MLDYRIYTSNILIKQTPTSSINLPITNLKFFIEDANGGTTLLSSTPNYPILASDGSTCTCANALRGIQYYFQIGPWGTITSVKATVYIVQSLGSSCSSQPYVEQFFSVKYMNSQVPLISFPFSKIMFLGVFLLGISWVL